MKNVHTDAFFFIFLYLFCLLFATTVGFARGVPFGVKWDETSEYWFKEEGSGGSKTRKAFAY